MSKPKRSWLRQWLIRVPIPVLALALGLGVGLLVWFFIDRVQTDSLREIFAEELDDQLHQRAREALIRFDEYRQAYRAVTRLLANHRRLGDYLDPIIWIRTGDYQRMHYRDTRPGWLPEMDIWRGIIRPSHVVLLDTAGRIREQYTIRGEALPAEVVLDGRANADLDLGRSYLTTLTGKPFLVTSEFVEDASYRRMGSLVVAVPIDGEFLSASQQRVNSGDALVAILDADEQRILSSVDANRLPAGVQVEELRSQYVVTAQTFYEYDTTDLKLLFATLVPKARVEATGQRVLDLERRQRLLGTGTIIAVFVLLFVLMSSRLNRLLRRLALFSRRALDLKQSPPNSRGNQLLILEDWSRDFIATVMQARDDMRARHETEIRESEALNDALMETSLDSIVTIDQHGRIIEFNPTAERTFGHKRERALGQQLEKLLLARESRGDFVQRLYASLERGLAEADPARFELCGISRDGISFPVEMAIKPTLLRERLLYTVYIHDISYRKRQEAEIKSLAAIPSESPIPVLRVNRPGVIVYANQPSESLLKHWGCKRLQTLPVYWKQQVEEVIRLGRTHELEVRTDDGILSLLLAPVRELGYVNIYARDITKMREAQQEAQRRQNELIHVSRLSTMGEMATGLAHELNQPLSAIVNFANGGNRRVKLGSGKKNDILHAFEQIAEQAGRAGEIIKRMRGMVVREQPVREVADLNQLVSEVCALMSHDTRQAEVTIERVFGSRLLSVRVDPVQIEQVLLNLMRNALDALANVPAEQRRLVVTTGNLARDAVYVAVHDNGPGIQPKVMERLFDPFFTTKKSGMGMGLAITQTIVAEHNGKIRADSWPDKGTTFTLELPALRVSDRVLVPVGTQLDKDDLAQTVESEVREKRRGRIY